MSVILNTSERDALYQFSHVKHDMYRYIPNTYKIGYDTKDLSDLSRYRNHGECDILPPRKEIIARLKTKCDVIQFSRQMIKRSYYFNNYRRHRHNDRSKHIKYIYHHQFSDTEKAKLTLKFQISGFIRGVLDEYLENNWKILRTVYDDVAVSIYKYPSLHDDIFKILSLYIVDHEEYRYLYPPLMDEYKLWVNALKILPLQSNEWKQWFIKYLLKDKLHRNGYNVSKNKNKVLYEQIKNATFEDFDSDTQHLWSEWVVRQCVESATNRKNKSLATFYFKYYRGRIFPKDFKIIFDFYQDNTKMLKILARYPFFCDNIEEWVERFKYHYFFNENNTENENKEYKKWKFLMDSLIKNYHSYSTKQLYKKSIITFLKQIFVELIVNTEHESEDEQKNDNDLLWQNMEYLLSKIVHGSTNSNNKYFYTSNHFDQILKYNNAKVFEWCVDKGHVFMDPLILIKRPDYFDKCIEFIQCMTMNQSRERLNLFKQFIQWNFESILYHNNKRIANKWIDGTANNNVITVYSGWINAILEPEYGCNIHTEYAQVLQQYVDVALLRSHTLQI